MSKITATATVRLLVVEVELPLSNAIEAKIAIISCKEVPTGYKYLDLIEAKKGSFRNEYIYSKHLCDSVGIEHNQKYKTIRVLHENSNIQGIATRALNECIKVAMQYRKEKIEKYQKEHDNLANLLFSTV